MQLFMFLLCGVSRVHDNNATCIQSSALTHNVFLFFSLKSEISRQLIIFLYNYFGMRFIAYYKG